jgi:hypothetical protein
VPATPGGAKSALGDIADSKMENVKYVELFDAELPDFSL